MENQEETLVLNYLDEDYQNPDPDPPLEEEHKLDESYDENQNPKITIKEETPDDTPQKTKTLKVILEKKDLSPKKLDFGNLKNKQNNVSRCDTTPSTENRKRGRPSKENKNMLGTDPKRLKNNGSKSPFLKSPESKTIKQKKIEFPCLPKSSNNVQNNYSCDNLTDKVIKVENVDDNFPVSNSTQNNNKDCEDIAVKYETVEQIHTEFKYESLSETEENLRKKKQAIYTNLKKKEHLKSPNNFKVQSTLDSFFKVVDLKSKCKLSTPSIFKCNQCLYVGNSRANLERHSLIHKDPNEILWYKCTECEYKSKYEHQLKGHTLIHMNPDEIKYFQCPHCELKCSRKHNLTNHIRSIHSDRVNCFYCADCEYSTFSKDRLVAHVKRHSKQVFTCSQCKFVTKRKEYLESHYKIKHTESERPFPCDTCSYKGKTKRDLDHHYGRMHNKEKLKTYQCNFCDFNSIYKKNLEFHLLHMHQNSEGFQKFVCGHCSKEFAYKNGLKTHIIRIHLKLTDEDWHKCQECKYKCKDINTLKRHIKRNHGAPRLHCKKCSFATNRQKSMIAHMNTHEVDAEEILKCPECPYRILKSTSFIYHMRVVHGKLVATKGIQRYYLKDD